MESGIVVRKTPAHVSQQLLDLSTFVFVESDAFVRSSCATKSGPRYFPMISGFLGAKTWPVKKREMEFVRRAGASVILYFPDLRNIKYGEFDGFCEEIASIDGETEGTEVIVYVAVDFLKQEEMEDVIAEIAKKRFKVMLGFGGCDGDRKTPAAEIVEKVSETICKERLWCAFWDVAELEKSRTVLEEVGIQRVVGII
jgi:hypothetical protein